MTAEERALRIVRDAARIWLGDGRFTNPFSVAELDGIIRSKLHQAHVRGEIPEVHSFKMTQVQTVLTEHGHQLKAHIDLRLYPDPDEIKIDFPSG